MLQKGLLILLVMVISLTACGTAPLSPTSTSTAILQTPTQVLTATSTATPDIYMLAYAMRDLYGNFEVVLNDKGVAQQVVFTNGPTFELIDDKLVERASEKQDEHELNPRSVISFDTKYKGVQIKGDLITDESLLSVVNISLPENAYAKLISEAIFNAWWNNGVTTKTGVPTEEDRVLFMALWAKAQESNDPIDWKKIQFTAWANDLNNGDGYIQEKFVFWPMHEGEAPDGVRNISKLSIAVVSTKMFKNVDITDVENELSAGMNIDGDELFFYTGTYNDTMYFWPKNIAMPLSTIIYWLGRSNNNFSSKSTTRTSMPMVNYLLSNGLLTGVLWE